MSAREFDEWAIFYAEEPFGELRADLRTGIIASILTNVHRRRGSKPTSPGDFVLKTKRAAQDDETAKNLSFLRAVAVRK